MTDESAPRSHGRSDALFILAAFVGSSLIFVVQPMVARQLLPTLGGAPAVWTTCMLFFQTCLLAGYAWAHFGPKWLGGRVHAVVHVALLIAALCTLPLGISAGWHPSADSNPSTNVLIVLTRSIGLPMCVLAATSPLLQRWHRAVNPSQGDRVYRLYSIGNVASLLVLLAYPIVIEPMSTLHGQRVVWSWLFGGLAFLLCACAIVGGFAKAAAIEPSVAAAEKSKITWQQITWWVLLSAVPSSYLLGVTSYLTSDVAAVPFLWVLPLALYLGAFSLAFAGRSPPDVMRHALAPALALICLAFVGCAYTVTSVPTAIVLHVGTFFVLAYGCLAGLYQRRPTGDALTAFYLWIAVGGALGGACNSLVAPRLFTTTLEYPIALLLCAALAIVWPYSGRGIETDAPTRAKPADRFIRAMVIIVLVAAAVYAISSTRARFLFSPNIVMALLGGPIILCFIVRRRPVAFGLCAGTLAGSLLALGFAGQSALETHRSFFGVHRVMYDGERKHVQLFHGTTLHGQQSIDPITLAPILSDMPLNYYHREGPVGDIFRIKRPKRVGVVGLGIGNLAAYLGAGDSITYFEIDPVVIELAKRSDHFSYLSSARARGTSIDIVPGDARLTLADSDAQFDLLILDAFSGDAIPAHLLTREAFSLYARRLAPGGTLAVHISNRYLDLRHVVANGSTVVAPAALINDHPVSAEEERATSRIASIWMIIPTKPDELQGFREAHWEPVAPGGKAWTDDFTDLLSTLK